MNATILFLTILLLPGCVGLDPKNEGFAENAGEVVGRTFLGVMTLGISERVIAEDRKAQRIRERQEVQRQKWYDGLSDQEKNIEDMREAHRYQLMGTIMQGKPFPTMQLTPPPAYTIPQSTVPPAVQRPHTNCISSVMGSQITTNCY